jgi:cytochrome bd-type quinol oxidase subunit 1
MVGVGDPLVVVQALVLIVWWFWQVRTEDPWGAYGWANMAVQWAIALAFFMRSTAGWCADEAGRPGCRGTTVAAARQP